MKAGESDDKLIKQVCTVPDIGGKGESMSKYNEKTCFYSVFRQKIKKKQPNLICYFHMF